MFRAVLFGGVLAIAFIPQQLTSGEAPATSYQQPTPQVPAQQPAIGVVDTPTVTVLRGLSVPDFEAEMQLMTSSLGVSCGFCHTRGNFASDANPHKAVARRMLEMTRTINQQFFPEYKPAEGESRLGRVTCFTCHQGNERPKTAQ